MPIWSANDVGAASEPLEPLAVGASEPLLAGSGGLPGSTAAVGAASEPPQAGSGGRLALAVGAGTSTCTRHRRKVPGCAAQNDVLLLHIDVRMLRCRHHVSAFAPISIHLQLFKFKPLQFFVCRSTHTGPPGRLVQIGDPVDAITLEIGLCFLVLGVIGRSVLYPRRDHAPG